MSDTDRENLIQEIKTRPQQPVKCERILVPVDGSEHAFKAAGEAIRLARVTGAELSLLMVVDYDREVTAFEQVSLSGYVPAELKVAACKYLAKLMHVIPAGLKAHIRVEAGKPEDMIPAIAKEEESDLIVMGSRGLGAAASLLAGSVSRAVLQQAVCPVLICK